MSSIEQFSAAAKRIDKEMDATRKRCDALAERETTVITETNVIKHYTQLINSILDTERAGITRDSARAPVQEFTRAPAIEVARASPDVEMALAASDMDSVAPPPTGWETVCKLARRCGYDHTGYDLWRKHTLPGGAVILSQHGAGHSSPCKSSISRLTDESWQATVYIGGRVGLTHEFTRPGVTIKWLETTVADFHAGRLPYKWAICACGVPLHNSTRSAHRKTRFHKEHTRADVPGDQ
jgi:hypothetical protein